MALGVLGAIAPKTQSRFRWISHKNEISCLGVKFHISEIVLEQDVQRRITSYGVGVIL